MLVWRISNTAECWVPWVNFSTSAALPIPSPTATLMCRKSISEPWLFQLTLPQLLRGTVTAAHYGINTCDLLIFVNWWPAAALWYTRRLLPQKEWTKPLKSAWTSCCQNGTCVCWEELIKKLVILFKLGAQISGDQRGKFHEAMARFEERNFGVRKVLVTAFMSAPILFEWDTCTTGSKR